MFGNSGNSHSNMKAHRQMQLGPTIRNFHFSFMNFHLFSHNANALNRTFRRNSSRVLFAVVLIIFLVQFGGQQKHEIKIKSK